MIRMKQMGLTFKLSNIHICFKVSLTAAVNPNTSPFELFRTASDRLELAAVTFINEDESMFRLVFREVEVDSWIETVHIPY